MAISQDEWKGELTSFLDKLPPRPCIVPPPPSFCTVCGRLNGPVAGSCKFYPLRFERETGRTSIESASFAKKRDTFEFDADFEDEEEEELYDAPMIEFGRPERVFAPKAAPIARAVPMDMAVMKAKPATPPEPDIVEVEAELVEVVEEPAEEPAGEPPAPVPPAPPEAKPPAEDQGVPPEKMTVIAPIYHHPKLKIIAQEKPAPKEEDLPLPPPPPDYKGPVPAEPKKEEAPPEKPPAPPEEAPPAPAKTQEPEAAPPPAPPVPPPPGTESPAERPIPPPPGEQAPKEPPKEAPAPKPEPSPPEKAQPAMPTPPPVPATGRRTGGLYDIFRRKPGDAKKEAPAGPKEEQKKKEDEELLKKLKNIDKK